MKDLNAERHQMKTGANRVKTMETYLRRTYAHKKAQAEKDDFPFWDYR